MSCYASVRARLLNRDEAVALMRRLVEDGAQAESQADSLFAAGVKGVSVADVYRARAQARRAN